MNRRDLLLLGVVVQILALCGLGGAALYPHLSGRLVVLATRPYDPRDLFLGNYAQLNPEISQIERRYFDPGIKKIKRGDTVYVTLLPQEDVWRATRLSLERPKSGVFIRGIADSHFSAGSTSLSVSYGIERLYASPERALAIDANQRGFRRDSGLMTRIEVMIAPNGAAAIKGVLTSQRP